LTKFPEYHPMLMTCPVVRVGPEGDAFEVHWDRHAHVAYRTPLRKSAARALARCLAYVRGTSWTGRVVQPRQVATLTNEYWAGDLMGQGCCRNEDCTRCHGIGVELLREWVGRGRGPCP
jgi:hypothetical protein